MKPYNVTTFKPSSRFYSTRKISVQEVSVTPEGAESDYNHYRTTALKSTPDRAISILTADAMEWLKGQSPAYAAARDGDLGENLFVGGLAYDSFQVGQRYKVGTSVVLEVTEPVVPCANLCKLSYINSPDKSPKERVQACKDFIELLERKDGLRGWYAKVVVAGHVRVGDTMKLLKEKVTEEEEEDL